MKKLLFAVGLLAFWSCSDPDLQTDENNNNTNKLTELDLKVFEPCEDFDFDGQDVMGKNRECLQNAINDAVSEQKDGLLIGELNCYVRVAMNSGLQIPSNFTLVMSDATHLRISPVNTGGGLYGYSLFEIGTQGENVEHPYNITITGGHLYGDREIHPDATEQGHVIRIWTASQVTIDNVHIQDSNADGIYIRCSEENELGSQTYVPPSYININNCKIDNSRRCNISIVDGVWINLLQNSLTKAGQDMAKIGGGTSLGTYPKCGLNIEGMRERNSVTNEMFWFAHPKRITVVENTESGSVNHALYVGMGSEVRIEKNTTQRCIGYTYGDYIEISGNTINGNGGFGLAGGSPGFTDSVHHNTFFDNTVNNCSIGITVYNNETLVAENRFLQCGKGIQFLCLNDAKFYRNKIVSSLPSADGVQEENDLDNPEYHFAKDVRFIQNEFYLSGGINSDAINISGTNTLPNYSMYTVSFTENEIVSTGRFQLANVNGYSFEDNKIVSNLGMWLIKVALVGFQRNLIETNPTGQPSPFHIVSTVYINDCNASTNVFKNNEIKNYSTNANTHSFEIEGSSKFQFIANRINHTTQTVIWVKAPVPSSILPSSDLTFIDNIGDIGARPPCYWFIYAPACPGITVSNNQATVSPFIRQHINGTTQLVY